MFLILLLLMFFQHNFAFENESNYQSSVPESELRYSRISDKKCKQYQAPIFDLFHRRDVFTGEHIIMHVNRCPHSINEYIVGGSVSKPKEFPHMALIGSSTSKLTPWFCGGTLISDQYVLTAAHCLQRDNDIADIVRLGELDYDTNLDDAVIEDFEIVEKYLHENYTRKEAYNDIALFKLNRKVNFTRYIRPACLSTNLLDYKTKNAIATGWGATFPGEGTRQSSILKRVVLESFDYNECNMNFKNIKSERISTKLPNYVRNISQICFGSHYDNRDTCIGDSGGPLQIYHHDLINYSCMYSVIGVTSLGHLCGVRFPGIYTTVYYYLDWIEGIVWPNEKL